MLDSFLFHQHLDDDEEILLIAHGHWLFGAKAIALPTVLFFATMFLPFIANYPVVWVLTGLLLIGIAVWWVHNFFDYYLDAWLITDHGIIDLAWHGWFHRESSRVLYSDVQGVSYEIQGVMSTLLRYGELSVEKISTGSTIALPNVPHPRSVERIILDAMETYVHGKNLKDAKTVQTILSEFVASQMQAQEFEEEEEEDDEEGDDEEMEEEEEVKAFQTYKI